MKIPDNKLVVVGLALGLPSTILGVSFFLYTLLKKNIISETVFLLILVTVIFNTFWLMIRYVYKRKN